MSYSLATDGDGYEQHFWPLFIQQKFTSYENYWLQNVVPLTNRPHNIHFKNSADIKKLGISEEDICKAQLHYTALKHLIRTFELINNLKRQTKPTQMNIVI